MQSIANQVVGAARRYIGTRWHHQGRQKGVGIDCIGLAICVAHDLCLSEFDTTGYSRTPSGGRLRSGLREHMDVVSVADMRAGDIVLMRFAGEPQHVAILSTLEGGRMGMIHAYAQKRMVVEHGLDDVWKSRIVECYRFRETKETQGAQS